MTNRVTPFLLKLIGLTLIDFALLFIWNSKNEHAAIPHFYIIPGYFFLITAILHVQLLKSAQKEPKKFVYVFLASTGIRMLITILIFIGYLIINKSGTKSFAIAFILSYFVYLIFEVVELQSLFKK